ncbi:ABC transporter ATP-binding protein/permease [Mycoplasma enhydrae]|uniref:ABC transporter ATP-binding protein n=1 Tax=Mycoplasma enhydrae TaxID=2499220 RepID=UPI0021E7095E|nr:ABC transporter ATP-binding protein [Mycoplasma enhydrae]MCV3733613.1 ABC transporter ATP-binding protein/permease [Mycoplasma enhydrae]
MFKLYKYMDKKFRWLSALSIFLTIFQVVSFLFVPIFVGQISSLISLNAFRQSDPSIPDYSKVEILKLFTVEGTINESIKLFSIYFAIALLVGIISSFGTSLLATYISVAGSTQIRQRLWNHLGNLSQIDIETLSHSKIITRFTIDINRIQWGLYSFLRLSIIGPLNLIFGLVFALLTDLKLSIVFGVLIPMILMTVIIGGLVVAPLFKKEQKANEKINNESRESISGAKVIKSYNLENLRFEKFDEANNKWQKISRKTWNVNSVIFSLINLFSNIIIALVLLVTGYVARNSHYSQAEFKTVISNAVTFTSYVIFVTVGIVLSAFVVFSLVRAFISGKEINKIFTKKPNIDYKETRNQITSGNVEFKNVSFNYSGILDNNNVLDNISFSAFPGQVIGIIGPTGSGKTTIARLISLDFKTLSGSIKIDGHEITEIATKSIRNNISFVYQKPSILSGTIKTNLLMANQNASEKDLIDSTKNACAYEFIQDLENKFDHEVQQRGANLSGGQKQRLSIAQGLLKKPKILILDDSTSALDSKTEAKVLANIKNNYNQKEMLTFVIAQKISSIMNADNILVMDNGKIISSGKHDELMQKCDLYREIALSQLGGENV